MSPSAKLVSLATAVPPNVLSQSDVAAAANQCFGGRYDEFERIDPDRVGDVLELGRAEIADREIEPPLHLPVGVLGQTDRARRGDALQPRGDVDPIAHQVAVALLDDVAEVNADAKLDAALVGGE
jgi:hypothetical protein